MSLISAFLSGVLAAFTPCIIVLIPALIYRFTQKEEKPKLAASQFVVAFLLFYAIIALFVTELLSSTVKQGFQLGIGILFIALGGLALAKRFNPLSFPLIKNPFLFGLVFAIIASVNPCALAYFGIVVSAAANKGMLFLSTILFAIGLLLPAAAFTIFGKTLFNKTKKTGRFMHYLNNLMNVLLIIIGGYIIYTIKNLNKYDIIAASVLLIITFIVILRSFHFFYSWKKILNIQNILLLLALLLIIGAAIFHCNSQINKNMPPTIPTENSTDSIHYKGNPFLTNTQPVHPTCSANIGTCVICKRCITLFGLAAILGTIAILFTYYLRRRQKYTP